MPLGPSKVAEEVFVDPPENVPLAVDVELGERLEQRDKGRLLQLPIRLGENPLEVVVLRLDRLHRIVDSLPDVGILGQGQQRREPRRFRKVHHPPSLIVFLTNRPPSRTRFLQLSIHGRKLMVGVPEEDQSKDRDRIFRRLEIRVRPEMIRTRPQPPLDLAIIIRHRIQARNRDHLPQMGVKPNRVPSCPIGWSDASGQPDPISHPLGSSLNLP